MLNFVELWSMLAAIANDAETIANAILVFAFLRWCYGFRTITLTFSEKVVGADKKPTGEIRIFGLYMRACDINASSLTNAVSSAFYGGGFLPADVRQQIIEKTNPSYRVI